MAPTSAVLLLAVATLVSALALTKKRELVYYIELEHINLTYWNPKYYKYLNVSTIRYSRKDPNYYLNIHGENLVPVGNNVTCKKRKGLYVSDMLYLTIVKHVLNKDPIKYILVYIDAYIYEFLSNEYRRSFVEIHLGFCDLLFKDKIFSPYLNKVFPRCPIQPGSYSFENVTFPNHPILKTFPFTKGRFYGSGTERGTGEMVFNVYVDAAIKQRWLKN